jgi:hypothetical protein
VAIVSPAAFGGTGRDVRAAGQGEGQAAQDQAIQGRVVVQAVRGAGDDLSEFATGPGAGVCADGQPEGCGGLTDDGAYVCRRQPCGQALAPQPVQPLRCPWAPIEASGRQGGVRVLVEHGSAFPLYRGVRTAIWDRADDGLDHAEEAGSGCCGPQLLVQLRQVHGVGRAHDAVEELAEGFPLRVVEVGQGQAAAGDAAVL